MNDTTTDTRAGYVRAVLDGFAAIRVSPTLITDEHTPGYYVAFAADGESVDERRYDTLDGAMSDARESVAVGVSAGVRVEFVSITRVIPEHVRTELVSTDVLRAGDIVWNHGMRIELLSREEYAGHGNGPSACVWALPGRVLNVADVDSAGLVPRSWRNETRPQYVGTDRYSDAANGWTIQGNEYATWIREIAQ